MVCNEEEFPGCILGQAQTINTCYLECIQHDWCEQFTFEKFGFNRCWLETTCTQTITNSGFDRYVIMKFIKPSKIKTFYVLFFA